MYIVVIQLLSCVWLYDPMDYSIPGLPIPHYFLELAQVHVHWVGDAILPSTLFIPNSLNIPSPHSSLLETISLFSKSVSFYFDIFCWFWKIAIHFLPVLSAISAFSLSWPLWCAAIIYLHIYLLPLDLRLWKTERAHIQWCVPKA